MVITNRTAILEDFTLNTRELFKKHPNENGLINYANLGNNSSSHTQARFTPFELTFGHINSRNTDNLLIPKEILLHPQTPTKKVDTYKQVERKLQNTNKKF